MKTRNIISTLYRAQSTQHTEEKQILPILTAISILRLPNHRHRARGSNIFHPPPGQHSILQCPIEGWS
ncbi:hypothetical protein I7I48_01485 [Histoplasma ohiense]|nr:hypothetical protein I7I48_01485 [Histoplasma ohiense (nom. inval.)]